MRLRAPPVGGARGGVLGCQLRPNDSWVEGVMWTAGRSLPGMSLGFALMAAIDGSTGSCATLSHGPKAPSLTGVSPTGRKGFTLHG
jgi:hypothetical protein